MWYQQWPSNDPARSTDQAFRENLQFAYLTMTDGCHHVSNRFDLEANFHLWTDRNNLHALCIPVREIEIPHSMLIRNQMMLRLKSDFEAMIDALQDDTLRFRLKKLLCHAVTINVALLSDLVRLTYLMLHDSDVNVHIDIDVMEEILHERARIYLGYVEPRVNFDKVIEPPRSTSAPAVIKQSDSIGLADAKTKLWAMERPRTSSDDGRGRFAYQTSDEIRELAGTSQRSWSTLEPEALQAQARSRMDHWAALSVQERAALTARTPNSWSVMDDKQHPVHQGFSIGGENCPFDAPRAGQYLTGRVTNDLILSSRPEGTGLNDETLGVLTRMVDVLETGAYPPEWNKSKMMRPFGPQYGTNLRAATQWLRFWMLAPATVKPLVEFAHENVTAAVRFYDIWTFNPVRAQRLLALWKSKRKSAKKHLRTWQRHPSEKIRLDTHQKTIETFRLCNYFVMNKRSIQGKIDDLAELAHKSDKRSWAYYDATRQITAITRIASVTMTVVGHMALKNTYFPQVAVTPDHERPDFAAFLFRVFETGQPYVQNTTWVGTPYDDHGLSSDHIGFSPFNAADHLFMHDTLREIIKMVPARTVA